MFTITLPQYPPCAQIEQVINFLHSAGKSEFANIVKEMDRTYLINTSFVPLSFGGEGE